MAISLRSRNIHRITIPELQHRKSPVWKALSLTLLIVLLVAGITTLIFVAGKSAQAESKGARFSSPAVITAE